jgi:hypothetical protein
MKETTKPFPLKSRLGPALKVLLLGWTGFLSLSAYSGEDATLVPPGQYAAVAEREIDSARESVHLALYLFNVPPERASEPGRLLEALIRARRRGVGVEVLLDGGESPFDPEDRNRVAVESLAQGGVDAAYVDGKILHAKVLVVDRKTLLLGSSNWTTAAFRSNVEADVLIRSTTAARSFLDRLVVLPRRPPPAVMGGKQLSVPAGFLFPPGKMGEMERRKDAGAFDLYLHFLEQGASTATFSPVDVAGAVAALGEKDEGPVANRRRLHRIFRRLKSFYGLAEFQESYGKDPAVRLSPLSSSETVRLPLDYFAGGWDRRLSLPGKVFLLLNLYYADRSPASPRWSLSRETLADRHGLTRWTVGLGSVDLRRHNLLEVDYDDQPTPDRPQRRPNAYRPGPFYDPAALEERFRVLGEKHGPEALARARKRAHLLYEDADAGTVERLILLENRYGREVLERAAALLGRQQPDNPKRNIAYLAGVARGLAGRPATDERGP